MATVDDVTNDTAAVESLALVCARLQIEHESRSEDEARRISCDAIRRWGEAVPVALLVKQEAGA